MNVKPFFHTRVVVSDYLPRVPKIQLSPDFPWCTAEFREETNRWLLNRFGDKEVAYKIGDELVMSSALAAKLRTFIDTEEHRALFGTSNSSKSPVGFLTADHIRESARNLRL